MSEQDKPDPAVQARMDEHTVHWTKPPKSYKKQKAKEAYDAASPGEKLKLAFIAKVRKQKRPDKP